MEAKWISKGAGRTLVIFFCGWGFDQQCISTLDTEDVDLVVLFDYQSLEMPALTTAEYDDVVVVAWSFGVWVAAYAIGEGFLSPHSAFAINGTLEPVSESYGIPPAIFNATLSTLSEASLAKFNMRICGGARSFASMKELLPKRDFEGQRNELEMLGTYFSTKGSFDKNRWKSALISRDDLIFPYHSMASFWGDKAISIDGPHLCFANAGSWIQLLTLLKS